MASSSSGSTSELRKPADLGEDSLAADLRKLVSSSELHRLCASATTDRQAPVAAASGDGVVSWGISTETQQVRMHRSHMPVSESPHAQTLAAFLDMPAGATL
jgi:hypothetical protein